jgi:hypothetical protein
MSVLLFVVAFCVVALLVYTTRYSGRIRVEGTRIVDAATSEAYACVVDLRRWPEWSPWLDAASAVESRHLGPSDAATGTYRWLRGDTEVGCIEHVRIDGPGRRIEQRLRMSRPFPVRARLRWQLAKCEGKTRVTCTIRGRVGFSMRAFAATVQGALALDVRYGLDRLARLVEPDSAERYAVRYEGVREIGGVRYAYVEHTGSLEGIGQAMDTAVRELRDALAGQGVAVTGEAITVYLRTSAGQRTTACRFAVPIGEAIVEGVSVASLPAHRAFVATLEGSREHLELAWYLAMQRLSGADQRPDLRLTPSERYVRDAVTGSANDATTELRIPVL